jgi:hypothetical protein
VEKSTPQWIGEGVNKNRPIISMANGVDKWDIDIDFKQAGKGS